MKYQTDLYIEASTLCSFPEALLKWSFFSSVTTRNILNVSVDFLGIKTVDDNKSSVNPLTLENSPPPKKSNVSLFPWTLVEAFLIGKGASCLKKWLKKK